LGEGAMGEVWRALDLRLEREVALKLLKDADDLRRKALISEAKPACQLNHPNSAHISDAGRVDRTGRAGGLGALASLALAFSACVVWPAGSGPGAAPMPLPEALELRDGGRAVLIDVRSQQAYARGHIPGALNLPFDEFGREIPEELLGNDEVVVYCGSGITACVDLLALARAGREDAKLYPGSWSDWSGRGLPAYPSGVVPRGPLA